MAEVETPEDLNEYCPGCNKIIGLIERVNGQTVDGPGDRWQCAACKRDFCVDCYGRDNPLAGLNHDCSPVLGDVEIRFGVGAGGTATNEKV